MAPDLLVPVAVLSFLQLLILFFVIGVVVSAIAFSIYNVMFPQRTAADRLEALTAAAAGEEEEVVDIMGNADASGWEQIAERLGYYAQSQGEAAAAEAKAMRLLIKQAGIRNRRALEVYNGARVMCALLFPLLASPLALAWTAQAALFAMVVAAAIGYYYPRIYIVNAAQKRQSELLRAFPDALDLMVSSVESGLSLDQSFKRVASELATVAPILSREFTLVNNEVAAGVERISALRHLEERTGLEEVRSFVNMLAQAERFGSSVSDSLRLYSNVAREKRVSRAEEKAGQVGSKLTIVMIVFFLPVLMLILLLPAVIRMFFGD